MVRLLPSLLSEPAPALGCTALLLSAGACAAPFLNQAVSQPLCMPEGFASLVRSCRSASVRGLKREPLPASAAEPGLASVGIACC